MRTCEAAPQSECISATVSGSLSLTQTRELRMQKPTLDHMHAHTRARTRSQSPANTHGFACAVQHIIPLRCSQTAFLLFPCHSPASVRALINMREISGILFFFVSRSPHKPDLLFFGAARATETSNAAPQNKEYSTRNPCATNHTNISNPRCLILPVNTEGFMYSQSRGYVSAVVGQMLAQM